ncbi:MAG: amino acid racemase [Acidobacteriota bacterium]|nr:amino acid racemase [Acidobacteriota bacterium]
MKTVGIIGGIGPESTIDYYRLIIDTYRKSTNDGSSPSIIIDSVDLQQVLSYVAANDLAKLTEYLMAEVERLARAGADFALIAANTPHIVFDALLARSPIPLISIVEATRDAALAGGFQKLGLFGTRFTMQGPFFFEVFNRAGMALVVPDDDDQGYIHDKYMKELGYGIFVEETRARMLAIGRDLVERHGIEALILGGTELPLLLRDASIGVPLLDTTKIHVERAVAELLS